MSNNNNYNNESIELEPIEIRGKKYYLNKKKSEIYNRNYNDGVGDFVGTYTPQKTNKYSPDYNAKYSVKPKAQKPITKPVQKQKEINFSNNESNNDPEEKAIVFKGKKYWYNPSSGATYHRNQFTNSKGAYVGIFNPKDPKTGKPSLTINVSKPQGTTANQTNLLGLSTTPEENLLSFEATQAMKKSVQNNLAQINFTPKNITHKNFVNAGIEIEDETVDHLTQNQRRTLLANLQAKNKSNHNEYIDEYLAKVLTRKGGKRRNRAKKSRKTRKA